MYVSGENTALKCHFANKPCVLCQCTWQLEAPILPNYQGLSAKPTALGRIISLQELQTNHVTVFFFLIPEIIYQQLLFCLQCDSSASINGFGELDFSLAVYFEEKKKIYHVKLERSSFQTFTIYKLSVRHS